MTIEKEQPLYATRFPHGLAVGPLGGYDVAPMEAFEEKAPGQIDMTYPGLKRHEVIAVGTKAECLRGARLIKLEEQRTRKHVPKERALELLGKIAESSKEVDPKKCPRCHGAGEGYVKRRHVKCFTCNGTGRRIP
jgi:hypothetical protein